MLLCGEVLLALETVAALRGLWSSVTDPIFWIVKLLLQLADSYTNRVETMSSRMLL